jgi:hypothetical protein
MTIISEPETITINKNKYKCDVCKKIEGSHMSTCYGCGIHVCNKCRIWLDRHPITGLDGGDCSWVLCRQCNEKSTKYYAKYRKAMIEIDKLEDGLMSDWRKECKKEPEND